MDIIEPKLFTLWRHKKTGGVYHIVANCIIEATDTPAVAYRKDGPIWVRPLAEFMDGRFEQVNSHGDAMPPREATP